MTASGAADAAEPPAASPSAGTPGVSTAGGRLGRGAGVMAAGTAASRVLGVLRASVLAAAVGVNAQAAGAFGVANTLPNMLYMLIAGGLVNAVLVPQVVRAYRTGQGQAYVDRLLTLSITLLAGATLLLTAGAPVVVRIAATTVDADYIHLATAFALWCIPQVFFYGLYTLLGQILNARGSFGPFMWAPVVNNLISIAGFGVFIVVFGGYEAKGPLADPADWGAAPIALLGGVATVGIICQALVLIIPLYRSGFRYRLRWDWRGAGLGTAGRVAGWTFGALLVGQLGILAVSRLSTAADQQIVNGEHVAGQVAYGWAFMIFMLPHSLVTVSLLTSFFTRLSAHAAVGDQIRMRRDAASGLRLIGVFTLLASAVLAVLAVPVIRVVLPTVTSNEAASIAPIVVAMSLGLPALGAWSLTQRIFYAYEDAKGLFWIQVAMAGVVATGVLVSWMVLPASWWVAGAGGGIALSYLLGAAWGGFAIRRRLGGTGRGVLTMHAKAALAAGLAAGAGWALVRMFGDPSQLGVGRALVVCVVVGTVMLAVDVAVLRLLRVAELGEVTAPIIGLLHRTMARTGPDAAPTNDDLGGGQVDVVLGRGTLLAERYRLDHPVATDLPGVERWLAQDQVLDREVTATLLRSGRVRQAQDGARRAALVTDARLLRVLDVGDHDGLAYVVTERAPGRTLADLTARGPLPADQARAIVGEAAVALETARRRGVHHLALRPSALHISRSGVVVSGLGMDGELRDHGLGDARSTTRADTVALVGLLYVALTGRRPGSPDGPWAAPMVGGTMVPPAELVPGIPNDLDTLCAVTLGPHDDGPHSPAELVHDLEPWVPVDVDGIDTAVAVHVVAPGVAEALSSALHELEGIDLDAGPGSPSSEPTAPESAAPPALDPAPPGDGEPSSGQPDEDHDVGEPADSTPAPVVRTSFRGSLAGVQSDRPGTPPPAENPPTRRQEPRVTGGLSTLSNGTGPRTSARVEDAPPAWDATARDLPPSPLSAPTRQPPSARPGHGRPLSELGDFDSLIGRSTEVLTRKRFDPTKLVLTLVAVVVLVGGILAFNAVTAPGGIFSGLGTLVGEEEGPGSRPTSFESPLPTTEPDGTGEPTTPSEPTSEAPSGAPPVIASAQMIDPPPGGDNNEHPEAVDLAIDGDPGTFWFSRTYASPTYGMKSGIGYAVTLAEPATVSKVTLTVRGTGGMVEVRATEAGTPTAGTVLASGAMSENTVLTLDTPTETQSIVLWFSALPQNASGQNRLELSELTIS